jgi:squalene synthase HpnC
LTLDPAPPMSGLDPSLAGLVVRARAGTENFPVALRVLPARYRADLLAVYDFARFVDELGDTLPAGALAALDAVDRDVSRLAAGLPATLPAVAGLRPLVERGLPTEPLHALVAANRQDQTVHRYRTFDDLVGYCRLSADPVGELVLHVFNAATPPRRQLSARVCTALQLIEHCQDVAEDLRNGRIYWPAEDLSQFGVSEDELAVGGPRARALLAFEAARAARLLDDGAPLVGTLRGWARLAVAGYVGGGRATVRALAQRGHDVWPAGPSASSFATGRFALATWVAGR